LMSQKEFQRVKVIENAADGRLSVREASRLLQLSERQVQRLKRRYQPDSVGWVQHGNCGRSMPWAVSIPQKQLILRLARGKYQGFNDSHLTEKLHNEQQLSVSRETVRRILRAAKLASPQKRRPRRYRSRRPPRPRFGMMVRTDASRHDWLEGRGPSPNPLSLSASSVGAISVTVSTTTRVIARSAVSTQEQVTPARPSGSLSAIYSLLMLGAIFATALPFGRRAGSRWEFVVGFMLFFISMLAIACGGGGSTHVTGTPSGTYIIVVTGTSGSNTQSLKLTLTVQ
jgi:transposase